MKNGKIDEIVQGKILNIDNELPQNPNNTREKYLFVNDIDQIAHLKIMEHDIWYEGDGDEILNFYRGNINIRYMYEPFFQDNKRSYFWAISATETDFERIHVPLYRDIIDTLSSIVGLPKITHSEKNIQKQIDLIYKENHLDNMISQSVVPLTLNEGWGCFKIDWDLNVSEVPIIQYYRAENVDFTYKYKNRLTQVIYKDFYVKGGETFLLMETRSLENKNLKITKELYHLDSANNLTPCSEQEQKEKFPKLNMLEITIKDFPYLLSVPTIFYGDSSNIGYGRSIMNGKLDLCDALDQSVSMSGMACRVSTPKEYFNTEFLERDNEGLPKAPKTFQRQYVLYKGGKDGSGTPMNSEPVQTTQPNVDYNGYMEYAQELSLHIMQGTVSPATLGIDVAKKDNANAQREKEKITVFTRRTIIYVLSKCVVELMNQSLCVNEYLLAVLNKKGVVVDGKKEYVITQKKYDIHCEFEEFADASFENKATIYGNMLSVDAITPELYVEQLWKDNISEAQKKKEIDYIKEQKEKASGGIGEMFGDNQELDESETSKEGSEKDLKNESFNRNNG